MTDRELMQQALEALEQVAEYFSADSTEAKTITALRERLAQSEQEPVAVTRMEDGYIKIDYLADPFPVGPLYAAPLQPAQPYPDNFIDALKYDVARRDSEAQQCRTDGRCQYAIDHGAEGMGHCPKGECVMSAQPESEPTAWKKKGAFHFCNQPPVDVEKWIPLYKSHTQRWQTWASLTDEEIETIHRSAWIQSTATLNDFARAVEAKLKEKNT